MKQIQGNCFFSLKKSAKKLTLVDYNTKCCSKCNSTAGHAMIHVSAYVHGTYDDNEAPLAALTSLHQTKSSRVFLDTSK